MTKKQYKWLQKICKERQISKSTFIRWALSKKIIEIIEYLNLPHLNKEQIDHLTEIAKTPWLNEDD